MQTHCQPLEKIKNIYVIGMLRHDKKWNHMKCSIKIREDWKSVKEKEKERIIPVNSKF